MKKISLILLGLFGLLLSFNVYAEETEYVRLQSTHLFSDTFHDYNTNIRSEFKTYSNFNESVHYFDSANRMGVVNFFHVDSLANISNKYHITYSLALSMSDMPTLVPFQDNNYLNSCIYKAQNSQNSRDYLSTCFLFNFVMPFNYSNLEIYAMPSEDLIFDINDNGEASFAVGDGAMYVIVVNFDITLTQTNSTFYFHLDFFLNGGYIVPYNTSVWTFQSRGAKITSVPFFTAENSLFSGFFNNLNFNMHGLTSVITAPLGFVNTLSSNPSVDTNMVFTIFNKNISIPNGVKLFWGRNDVSQFRIIWNVIIGGSILYFVYRRLFKYVKNLFNPDSTEVVDL